MSTEMHPALLAANEADARPVTTHRQAERVITAYLELCDSKPGVYEFYHCATGTTHRLSDAITFILAGVARRTPSPARLSTEGTHL